MEREAMAVIALHVPGMTCRRCVRIVTARLRDLPGVVVVAADAAAEEVTVQGEVSEDRVRAALAEVSVLVNGSCCGERATGC
jgi:copper chaperone CopZ